MTTKQDYRKMERLLLDIFGKKNCTKKQAIDDALSRLSLTEEQMRDSSTNGKKNIMKSKLGAVLAELCAKEILVADKDGVYTLAKTRPVIIHEEKCEAAILAALKEAPMTRAALRARLEEEFGTKRTASEKDDARLYTAIGTVLARLQKSGLILSENGRFALCKQCTATPDCSVELASLRAEYLARVPSMEKYVTLHGKTVLENTTVGGSEDGGIDGILTTRDCLGFEERVLVQTKNRHMTFSERDMRGFYGAQRAAGGSRGIFATTGTFHEGAARFLALLPDLVGIDGYRLFDMARETLYGIKKSGGRLAVDTRVIG